MKFLAKISGEIATKSPPVRRQMIRFLRRNLAAKFPNAKISGAWDHFFLETDADISAEIRHFPGLSKIHQILEFDFESLDDLFQKIRPLFLEKLFQKRFCVRVRRAGKHDFRSIDAEKFLGTAFLKTGKTGKIKLKNPDFQIDLEIRDQKCFVLGKKIVGAGGFPIGATGRVLVLLSGGFDSIVAAEMLMKKGAAVDFVFCNLGGTSHEMGVRAVAKFLAKTFSAGHDGYFFSVDFRPVIAEILKKITPRFRGLILKRMMFRAAENLRKKHAAIVTGESLAQVSSQTLKNLALLDDTVKMPIFRPLFGLSKNEIIARADDFGGGDFARKMPEFCAIISKNPATAAKKPQILAEEKKIDENLFTNLAVEKTPISQLKIEKIEMPTRHFLLKNEIAIDLREPEEIAEMPLEIAEKIEIPFFEIEKKFPELDPKKKYFLFCERGVVSRATAENLRKSGFQNVGIFLPKF